MSDTYIIRGCSTKGIKRYEIFLCLKCLLSNYSTFYESCYTGHPSKPREIRDIEKILLAPPSSSDTVHQVFSLNRYNFDQSDWIQSIVYYPNNGDFSMSFQQEELPSPDQLIRAWFGRIPTINVTIQYFEYLRNSPKKYFSPPSSDLFNSPSRVNMRHDYIQGVSAEMWFGEPFWQHAKCTREDLLAQTWLHCEERPTHLYVRAWPEPFTSAEGEQGEIQRRLLDLIFGINAENPCGIER